MFNPAELYYLASSLQACEQQDEAAYRTIINRSYYATFLAARQFADIKNSSGSIHREVLNYFEKRHEILFNQLELLQKLRNRADYNLNIQINKRAANESLRLARTILMQLEYLNSNT